MREAGLAFRTSCVGDCRREEAQNPTVKGQLTQIGNTADIAHP